MSSRHCRLSPWLNAAVHHPRLVAAKQPRPQPGRLQDLGVMQDPVYKTAIRDLDDLKRRLIAEWSCLQRSIVDDAVDQRRKRLRYLLRPSLPTLQLELV